MGIFFLCNILTPKDKIIYFSVVEKWNCFHIWKYMTKTFLLFTLYLLTKFKLQLLQH